MASLLEALQKGLQKTRTSIVRRLRSIFTDVTVWDESVYERLEAVLIGADLGVETALQIVSEIRDRYERGLIEGAEDVLEIARQVIEDILMHGPSCEFRLTTPPPCVVLIAGVNGSGKTTSAAKLSRRLQNEGKRALLGACDTFRAAGTEQLKLWAERVGCPVVAGKSGGDPAAVAFDAVTAGVNRGLDAVILDTAGRQHTRRDLMAELEKIRRAVAKACPGAPHHVLLTVDSSTGTNALNQAREFGSACGITGLILTKLDGSGRGGVVVAIRRELGHPVYFIGTGEGPDDLLPFDQAAFARMLFE